MLTYRQWPNHSGFRRSPPAPRTSSSNNCTAVPAGCALLHYTISTNRHSICLLPSRVQPDLPPEFVHSVVSQRTYVFAPREVLLGFVRLSSTLPFVARECSILLLGGLYLLSRRVFSFTLSGSRRRYPRDGLPSCRVTGRFAEGCPPRWKT